MAYEKTTTVEGYRTGEIEQGMFLCSVPNPVDIGLDNRRKEYEPLLEKFKEVMDEDRIDWSEILPEEVDNRTRYKFTITVRAEPVGTWEDEMADVEYTVPQICPRCGNDRGVHPLGMKGAWACDDCEIVYKKDGEVVATYEDMFDHVDRK